MANPRSLTGTELIDILSPAGGDHPRLSIEEIANMFVNEDSRGAENMIRINDYIQRCCPDCTIIRDGTNNKNFIIKKNDNSAGMVVQLSVTTDKALAAKQTFDPNNPPTYLAAEYGSIAKVDPELPDTRYCTTFVEFAAHGSTLSYAQKLQQQEQKKPADPNNENPYAANIDLAINVGTQLPNMYQSLSNQKKLYTDTKPANILLDENNKIFVADPKAFCGLDKLPTQVVTVNNLDENGQLIQENQTIIEFAQSAGYLSSAYQIFMNGKIKPDQTNIEDIWEQENSYQMAVVLHATAAGKLKYAYPPDRFHALDPLNSDVNSDEWKAKLIKREKGGDYEFQLNKLDCYQSEKGQCLAFLIQSLGHDIPEVRMSYKDAAVMLAILESDKPEAEKIAEFKVKQKEAEENIQKNLAKFKPIFEEAIKQDQLKQQKIKDQLDAKLMEELAVRNAATKAERDLAERNAAAAAERELAERNAAAAAEKPRSSTSNLMKSLRNSSKALRQMVSMKKESDFTENAEKSGELTQDNKNALSRSASSRVSLKKQQSSNALTTMQLVNDEPTNENTETKQTTRRKLPRSTSFSSSSGKKVSKNEEATPATVNAEPARGRKPSMFERAKSIMGFKGVQPFSNTTEKNKEPTAQTPNEPTDSKPKPKGPGR